jgi:hypothetical protein
MTIAAVQESNGALSGLLWFGAIALVACGLMIWWLVTDPDRKASDKE